MTDKMAIVEKTIIDVAEYLNITKEQAFLNIQNHEPFIQEDLKNSKTHEEFYKTSKNYIYELISWNVSPFKRMVLGEAMRFIAKNKLVNILDFGTGVGTDSMVLYNFNTNIYACDFNSEVSKFARWRFKKQNMNIPFLDVEKFPKNIGKIKFDGIICFDVLEHCEDINKILKDFHNILIDDGYLFLTIRLDNGDENVLHLKKYNNYTYKEFEDMMINVGFKKEFNSEGYYMFKKEVKKSGTN